MFTKNISGGSKQNLIPLVEGEEIVPRSFIMSERRSRLVWLHSRWRNHSKLLYQIVERNLVPSSIVDTKSRNPGVDFPSIVLSRVNRRSIWWHRLKGLPFGHGTKLLTNPVSSDPVVVLLLTEVAITQFWWLSPVERLGPLVQRRGTGKSKVWNVKFLISDLKKVRIYQT